MMMTHAWSFGAGLPLLHVLATLAFLVGAVLLLVWAIKSLTHRQLRTWGSGFLAVGVILFGAFAMMRGSYDRGMDDWGRGAPRMKMDMMMREDDGGVVVPLTAVPDAVRTAVAAKYPGAQIEEVRTVPSDDGETYTMDIENDGEDLIVSYDADGTFLGADAEVTLEGEDEDAQCAVGSDGTATCGAMAAMRGHDMEAKRGGMDAMAMSMHDMAAMLDGKTGDAFDQAFLEGMIPHHQGAIDMANAALKNAKHEELKALATAIIDSQQKEIDQMKAWMAAWGYTK